MAFTLDNFFSSSSLETQETIWAQMYPGKSIYGVFEAGPSDLLVMTTDDDPLIAVDLDFTRQHQLDVISSDPILDTPIQHETKLGYHNELIVDKSVLQALPSGPSTSAIVAAAQLYSLIERLMGQNQAQAWESEFRRMWCIDDTNDLSFDQIAPIYQSDIQKFLLRHERKMEYFMLGNISSISRITPKLKMTTTDFERARLVVDWARLTHTARTIGYLNAAVDRGFMHILKKKKFRLKYNLVRASMQEATLPPLAYPRLPENHKYPSTRQLSFDVKQLFDTAKITAALEGPLQTQDPFNDTGPAAEYKTFVIQYLTSRRPKLSPRLNEDTRNILLDPVRDKRSFQVFIDDDLGKSDKAFMTAFVAMLQSKCDDNVLALAYWSSKNIGHLRGESLNMDQSEYLCKIKDKIVTRQMCGFLKYGFTVHFGSAYMVQFAKDVIKYTARADYISNAAGSMISILDRAFSIEAYRIRLSIQLGLSYQRFEKVKTHLSWIPAIKMLDIINDPAKFLVGLAHNRAKLWVTHYRDRHRTHKISQLGNWKEATIILQFRYKTLERLRFSATIFGEVVPLDVEGILFSQLVISSNKYAKHKGVKLVHSSKTSESLANSLDLVLTPKVLWATLRNDCIRIIEEITADISQFHKNLLSGTPRNLDTLDLTHVPDSNVDPPKDQAVNVILPTAVVMPQAVNMSAFARLTMSEPEEPLAVRREKALRAWLIENRGDNEDATFEDYIAYLDENELEWLKIPTSDHTDEYLPQYLGSFQGGNEGEFDDQMDVNIDPLM